MNWMALQGGCDGFIRRAFATVTLVTCVITATANAATNAPLSTRGYYTTFMRMPTFGLPEWKQMIDCMNADGANLLILWTAGAFRSRQFPITWTYNADHKNVQSDFARALIDYAHTRGIKVLLGFTPFSYDGVNQFPLEHPELKATQKNGQPAQLWGMHSWGYNLCPAREASQRFMHDYTREMFFEFYPNADGLMIESSDYAICCCADCRAKYFEHEFKFVRNISDEVWRAKPDATIMVYPHYFSPRKVPGFDVAGAMQKLDRRWTLFFTPHSAHIDDVLVKEAKSSVYWNEGLTLGTPAKMRDGARASQQRGLNGYIASCEPFSCLDGPPGSGKPRQKPFHFAWLRDGEMPLNELPVRVNRIAYREYTRDPGLDEWNFRRLLGTEIFGPNPGERSTDDLLFVQDCWFDGADWFSPAPLLKPAELRQRAQRERWPAEKLQSYLARVERLRSIGRRYETSSQAGEQDLARISKFIVGKWDAVK